MDNHGRYMKRAGIVLSGGSLCLSLLLGDPAFAAPPPLPSVDEIMNELKISDDDKQNIRAGKIVDWTAKEGSDRELALGMAFLSKFKPADLQ